MHILIYTFHWTIGGIEKVIEDITSGFVGKDYQFSILTEATPTPETQPKLADNSRVFFRSFKPFDAKNKDKMRSTILRIDPDVVVVMGSTLGNRRVPLALMETGIPIIISEHNAESKIFELHKNSQVQLEFTRNLADYNHVLFPSYSSRYNRQEKVHAITNAIPRTSIPKCERKNIILSLARYDLKQKQQDILLKAFGAVAKDFPDWKLHLYGSDWREGKAQLLKLVRQLKIERQVELSEFHDNPIEKIAEAKILGFPSAFEGAPLTVLESLAGGLPVIAFSECEGAKNLIENRKNGFLVPGKTTDYKEFSKCLKEMMLNEKLRVGMSEYAPKSVEAYSIEKFISKWEVLFQKAIKQKGNTVLTNLSEMEKDYIKIVMSSAFKGARNPKKLTSKKLVMLLLAKNRYVNAYAQFWFRIFRSIRALSKKSRNS